LEEAVEAAKREHGGRPIKRLIDVLAVLLILVSLLPKPEMHSVAAFWARITWIVLGLLGVGWLLFRNAKRVNRKSSSKTA